MIVQLSCIKEKKFETSHELIRQANINEQIRSFDKSIVELKDSILEITLISSISKKEEYEIELEIFNDDYVTDLKFSNGISCAMEPQSSWIRIYQDKLELDKEKYKVNDTISGIYSMKGIRIKSKSRYKEDINDVSETEIIGELEIKGYFKTRVRGFGFNLHGVK